jgi:hypothetical protein
MRIDFIGIGAQKAGTTWLYEQLRHHPAIHLPKREPRIFYKDLPLTELAGAKPGQITGDITPVYAAAPGIAAKIAAVCPDAKLILSLRDPVERAWSQYKMAIMLGNIPRDVTFLEAFRDDRQWIRTRGHYADVIEEFSGFRMHIIDYNRILTEPVALLRELCRFLTIEPSIDEERARTPVEQAFAKDRSKIPPDAAAVLRDYYQPQNRKLVPMLSWQPDWIP